VIHISVPCNDMHKSNVRYWT